MQMIAKSGRITSTASFMTRQESTIGNTNEKSFVSSGKILKLKSDKKYLKALSRNELMKEKKMVRKLKKLTQK